MNVMGDFFATLPAALRALWDFGDGFVGVVLMVASIGMIVVFSGLAYQLRERLGWLSALFGSMAVLLGLWWALGIIPSAWIYFADSQSELLADSIVPSAIVIGQLEVASNFYNVFRDSIVMAEATVVLLVGAWLIFAVQKRFPGGLAEGEGRGPTTGGYK
ncbi:MAG TPA: hypothetical protein VK923_12545 [Euzebyales bacterium]|nr:hypothetical protein [Euzebyales bacterium]